MPQAEETRKLFGIILHRKFVFPIPCIYSTIHLYQYEHMDIFCILGYKSVWTFCFCSSRSSFGHWERFLLAPVSLCHTPIIVLLSAFGLGLLAFSYFWALLDASGSTVFLFFFFKFLYID